LRSVDDYNGQWHMIQATNEAAVGRSWLTRAVPAFSWLRDYGGAWLRPDVAAGITLAAYLLPAGLGDASLAGLPPEAGLYACLFSGLVFWLFCSSKHTAITVTSAISLLLGTTLGPMADGDVTRYRALAVLTAFLVGVLAFIAWAIRAGVIVSFISETVLIGFKTGVALVLAATQLPKLFGFKGGHGNFWENLHHFLTHLGDTHLPSLTIGLSALFILILGKRFLKNKPVALFVVVGGILAATLLHLGDRGVKMLGELPSGLPTMGLPRVNTDDLNQVLPLAMACFLLGAVETVAIGRMFASKHGYRLDANQEFLGLSAANMAAALGQGFAVSGGMSQSLVNESGGARTPLSGLIAALIILIVTLFFSSLLHNLPQPVLAAVVLMAVTGLFKLAAFQRLWRFSRSEFAVAFVATLCVLGSGILNGVLIGAVLSIILLLRRASRPHVAVLGRVPNTQLFGDIERNPENTVEDGVLVFRVDSAILYFNADFIRERFLALVNTQQPPVKLAVWCLATTVHIDLAGAEMLEQLHADLHSRGIEFALAEARGLVREELRAAGLEETFGAIRENATIAPIIRQWMDRHAAPAAH
jgi:high affinity sulfate transporter 1